MIKRRHILFIVLSVGLMLLLGGCKMAVMQPKGIIAIQEKQLLIDAVLLMLIVVIPVFIFTFLISRKYRASNTKAKYSPHWAHSTSLEFIWWFIPFMIIVVLATLTWRTTHALDPYKPLKSHIKSITIQVVALRWKWLFIYPKQNIATVNFISFPVHTPVNFQLTSDAPMNAFQIPQLGGQIYTMNGMRTKIHLMANTIGDYRGRSVSFSGNGFAGMKFIARVTSNKAFDQWVKSVKQSRQTLTMSAYNKLVIPSENNPVEYFSPVTKDLFHKVILKFMVPKMHKTSDSSIGVHL